MQAQNVSATPIRSNVAQTLLGLKNSSCIETRENDAPSGKDGEVCKCRKSKCLKLYCVCFAGKHFCGLTCRCVECANKTETKIVKEAAEEAILERNPNAFESKFVQGGAININLHKHGCRCRKSQCLKKYCECYNASAPCADTCSCMNCLNTMKGLQLYMEEQKLSIDRARDSLDEESTSEKVIINFMMDQPAIDEEQRTPGLKVGRLSMLNETELYQEETYSLTGKPPLPRSALGIRHPSSLLTAVKASKPSLSIFGASPNSLSVADALSQLKGRDMEEGIGSDENTAYMLSNLCHDRDMRARGGSYLTGSGEEPMIMS